MAIVFAAVVPHSPLLVPGIAKNHQRLSNGDPSNGGAAGRGTARRTT